MNDNVHYIDEYEAYNVHLSNVAMEIIIASFHSKYFNLGFAVQVALLHDTIEDYEKYIS